MSIPNHCLPSVSLVLVLGLAGCGGQEAQAPRLGGPAVSHSSAVSAPGAPNVDKAEPTASPATEQPAVVVTRLADGVWLHTSYKDLPGFGRVPSNGLIVGVGDAMYLVDTAWTDEQTRVVLKWTRDNLAKPITSAIVTHAHEDKMGGVAALHAANVNTYAHPLTNRDAGKRDLVPTRTDLVFDAGRATLAGGAIEIFYPGAGHTVDNVVVYVKDARVLFGGCLIRPGESRTMGNTADADTAHWDDAVLAVEAGYPDARIIVPSHGPPAGPELLRHTIDLARAHEARRD